MSTFFAAARPKTLPAAVCPVLVGCALAWHLEDRFSWLLAVATLLSTLCLQVATNFFNDAVDAVKGADTQARLGPQRATAAGLVSVRGMFLAGGWALGAAIIFSLPMVVARGWPILAIGVVSLFFTYGYTGGPWPLAYRGLGEVFVMLFFGLVAVAGTVFVQLGEWRGEALLAGGQVGALSTVLIAINNLRDREEDTLSGKRTLAVRCGVGWARAMIWGWCLLPYGLGWLWRGDHAALHWGTLPMALLGLGIALSISLVAPGRIYNRLLALSALHLLGWTVLFLYVCLQ